MRPTGIIGAKIPNKQVEWLTEYDDGIYISRECWEEDEYYGDPLPPQSRPVARYLSGSFVFFSKRSHFNRNMDSYDALHEHFGEDGFRQFIGDLAAKTYAVKRKIKDEVS